MHGPLGVKLVNNIFEGLERMRLWLDLNEYVGSRQ